MRRRRRTPPGRRCARPPPYAPAPLSRSRPCALASELAHALAQRGVAGEVTVRHLHGGCHDQLVLYDDAQSICAKRARRKFSFRSVGIEARGRTTILRLNYRNTAEVLGVACEFARELLMPEAAEEDGGRAGWQAGRFVPLASTATAQELVRVLGYPKFRLSAAEQDELLADFIPWVDVVCIPDPPPAAPACRDPFDLPLLHLAMAGRARVLVSGDRDLLALAGTPGLCPVLGIDAFCRQFLGD